MANDKDLCVSSLITFLDSGSDRKNSCVVSCVIDFDGYPLTNWPTIDPISAAGLQEVFVQVFRR